jgi:Flp pilus assembly protein TadG
MSNLAQSRSGNTVVILAAALIPLAAFVGAGFDMSRSYLVRSRLQTACDSGALAARRAMIGRAWGSVAQGTANQYFTANFETGRFGTSGLTMAYSSATGESVRGTASVRVPTTLMRIFGNDEVTVNVQCQAVMNLPNTDVMFVLDTTGSMADINPGDATSRMSAMRSAITAFHTTIESAKSSGTQVRYGFVPYSTNVNVGRLLKREWMVNDWTYQSREPDGSSSSLKAASTDDEVTYSDHIDITGSSLWIPSALPLESCFAPADTVVWGATTTISTVKTPFAGPPAGFKTVSVRRYTASGIRYVVDKTATTCTLNTQNLNGFTQQFTETRIPSFSAAAASSVSNWLYRPIPYDVSGLKGSNPDGTMAGGSISAPIGAGQTIVSIPWSGCIEERNTVGESDYSELGTNDLHLDIDSVPAAGNPATQWRPAMPGLTFVRRAPGDWQTPDFSTTADLPNLASWDGGAHAVCPSAANKLAEMSSGQVTSYLSGLVPSGNTYHDIGMVWGLRLLSPTGLFASENALTPGGRQITRHVIFMTDGDTLTDISNTDAYGLPALDRRRTDPSRVPTNAETNALVEARLSALCAAAKDRNTTVWVIAFGTTLTPLLSDCASTGSAFQANNTTALNIAFGDIASKIANLRLNN